MLRQGLKRLIESKPGMKVIGEAADGIELLSFLSALTAHMVILDISMPKLRGIEAVREIKNKFPLVKVLVLTMHREYLHQALAAGADGYLLKEDTDRELFSAIENVRQDKTHISLSLKGEMATGTAQLSLPLSTREIEVLKLIAGGQTNKDTAEMISISIRTVEKHRASIMSKLRLKNTANLVNYAIQQGYVEVHRALFHESLSRFPPYYECAHFHHPDRLRASSGTSRPAPTPSTSTSITFR
jgi:DNA-binding NarL/FixJ family response regulator